MKEFVKNAIDLETLAHDFSNHRENLKFGALRYPDSLKQRVISAIHQGYSAEQVRQACGVSRITLNHWLFTIQNKCSPRELILVAHTEDEKSKFPKTHLPEQRACIHIFGKIKIEIAVDCLNAEFMQILTQAVQ